MPRPLSVLFGFLSFLAIFAVTCEKVVATDVGGTDTVVIADIYLSGMKTEQVRPGVFDIAFDIINEGNVLDNLKVRVDLVEVVDNFIVVKDSWADTGTFRSVPGQMSKAVEYAAPEFLSGEYKLMVNIHDASGLLYTTNSAGTVTLGGSGRYVSIRPDQCYLTVDGDAEGTRYPPSIGVDVDKDETLVGHCPVQNLSGQDIHTRIVLETFWRSLLGASVQPATALPDDVFLSVGETKDISFVIPTVRDPQAYSVAMYLNDDQGQRISDEAEFHYVMRGVSATVQQAAYSVTDSGSGSVVDVSFTWTPSADSHIQKRAKQEYSNEYFAQLSWKSPSGESYAVGEKTKIGGNGFTSGPAHANIGLPKGFENPVLALSITDESGKILGERTLRESARDRSIVGTPTVSTDGNGDKDENPLSVMEIAFVTFGTVTAALFVLILAWKYGGKSPFLWIVGTIILMGTARQAEAKSVVHRDYDNPSHYFEVTANFDLERRPPEYYLPGDTMVFYYSLTDAVCNDGVHTGSTLRISAFGNDSNPDFVSSGVWGGSYEAHIPIPSDQTPGMYTAHACVNIGVWEGTTYACADIPFEVKERTFKFCSGGAELSQISLSPGDSRDLQVRFGTGSGCSDASDADVASGASFVQSIVDGASDDAVALSLSPTPSIRAMNYVSPLFDADGQQVASETITASYDGGKYSKSLLVNVVEYCRNLCADNAPKHCQDEKAFFVPDSCGVLQDCGAIGARDCNLNWKEPIPGL